ncbi:MAG: Hsp20/alpha crystallin family protein [Synechococcales cyanobacterium CRU_2_2]|nr:Hsp20/alpha crystallin family protein [Synechococcales cyanobacterium CRU_2_2]
MSNRNLRASSPIKGDRHSNQNPLRKPHWQQSWQQENNQANRRAEHPNDHHSSSSDASDTHASDTHASNAHASDSHTSDSVSPSLRPAIETQETAEALYIDIELPGLSCQSIEIRVVEQTMVIQGRRMPRLQIPPKAILESEFFYGTIERRIDLPERVCESQIKAEYINGILRICLLKSQLSCITQKNVVEH